MGNAIPAELIEDFLGSAYIFGLALAGVLEEKLLRETSHGKLTSAQMKLLKLMAQADRQTVSDIACFLGVSTAAASKIVERLVRRKYLRRSEAAADRRSSQLSLTPAGRQLLADYQLARSRQLLQSFGEFPADELQRTAAVLDQLAARIVTHSVEPEQVCLQCGIYFKERCLLQEVVRRNCNYRIRRSQAAIGPKGNGGRRS